jgi:hypothetical protein
MTSRAYKEAAVQLAIERGCLIQNEKGLIKLNPELEKWIVNGLQEPKLDNVWKVVIYAITGYLGVVQRDELERMTGGVIGYLNAMTGTRLEK